MKHIRLRNILIAVCACGLAVIAGATSMMIAGLSASKASISFEDATVSASYGRYFVGGDSGGTSQTNAQALFGKDKINSTTATELMKVIDAVRPFGNANKTAADFSAFVNTKVAKQGAVYVRLFEPMTSGTVEAQSFTKSTHASTGEEGKGRWWRIVHLEGDVLTLWMAEGYRDSVFGANNTYSSSTIRTNLLNDFTNVYANYNQDGKTAIDSTIVTTTPYSIVATTGDGAGSANWFTNPTVSDKVWLPSAYEIFNTANNATNYNTTTNYTTTRAGYWQVNGIDRAYNYSAGSVNSSAWLRSAISIQAVHVSYSGTRLDTLTSFSLAARPALHIDLRSLGSHIVAEIE